jgi:hypothetical protein
MNESSFVHGLGDKADAGWQFACIRCSATRHNHNPDLVLRVNLPGQLKAIYAAPGQLHVRDHGPDIKTGSEHLKSFLSRSDRYDPETATLQHGGKGKASQNLVFHKKDEEPRVGTTRRC